MNKQTNIHFKVKMTVDGKQQAVNLGMSLGELEAVTERVNQSNRRAAESTAAVMTRFEYLGNAVRTLQSCFSGLTNAYRVQEQAEQQLATAMRNTMGATDSQVQAIKELASAQQGLGVIGDEVQLQGAKQLATYLTQTTSLEKLIPLMNDMAVAQYGMSTSGQQLQSIADSLGKAMLGQDRALKSYGITLDEEQKALLKNGTEAERVALIYDLLNAKVGGQNAAAAQTATGAIQQMTNAIGDQMEVVGRWVAPIQPMLELAASTTLAFSGMMNLAKGTGLASVATKGFTLVNKGLTTALTATGVSARAASLAVKSLYIATGVGAAIVVLTTALEALSLTGDKTEEQLQSVMTAIDAMKQAASSGKSHMESQAAALKRIMDAGEDTTSAVNSLNAEYGAMFGQMKTAAEWYDVLISKSGDYAKALGYQAQLQSLNSSLAAARMELEYQQGEEKKNRTGRYSGRTVHNEAGKKAAERITELKGEIDRLIGMIAAGEEMLSAIDIDLMQHGTEWTPGSDNPPGGSVTPAVLAPEGSLKALQEQISAVKGKIAMAVDDERRVALNRELKELEQQELAIRFRYEFPLLNSLGLNNLLATIDGIAQAMPTLRLDIELPDLAEVSIPESVKPKEPLKLVDTDNLEAIKEAQSVLGGLGSTMSSLSKVVGEGAGSWLSYGANVLSAVSQALPALSALVNANTAVAGSGAVAGSASAGPFGWIAGIAAMASVIAAIATLPKFAEGGIAYGPTVGLFGEYAGAANNPEVVAPLSRLESLIEPRTTLTGPIELRARGRELVAVINREHQVSSRR